LTKHAWLYTRGKTEELANLFLAYRKKMTAQKSDSPQEVAKLHIWIVMSVEAQTYWKHGPGPTA
jgi:hypothetical protein